MMKESRDSAVARFSDAFSWGLPLGFACGGLLFALRYGHGVGFVATAFGYLGVLVFARTFRTATPQAPVQSDTPPARSLKPAARPVAARPVADPGSQALAMLRRGENCDWYSIQRTDEQHEAFDSLEIYWRTMVEHPERNEFHYGRGPFELKAGFRVRWRVAGTHNSYVEAVGLDLLTTILEAREEADRLIARAKVAKDMGHTHPALEAWKAHGPGRKYSFDGLDPAHWHVRLEFPSGMSWAKDPDLDKAVARALEAGPVTRAEAPET